MSDNNQKLVAITGANSGVGLQVAKTFSAQGYSLLLLDLNIDVVEKLDLPNALCKQVNITDLEAFEVAITEAEEAFGAIDCLINNAGIMYMDEIYNQEPEQWKRMFDVNVLGLMNGVKAVVNRMIKRNTGTIINMGSLGGHKLIPGQTAYCGTKHAVAGISEGMRMELAESNVRMTVISPGAIETNLLKLTEKSQYVDGQNNWAKEIGGILVPEDIANSMLFVYQQPQNVCIREIVLAPTRQQV